jgi:hypothetical protein
MSSYHSYTAQPGAKKEMQTNQPNQPTKIKKSPSSPDRNQPFPRLHHITTITQPHFTTIGITHPL